MQSKRYLPYLFPAFGLLMLFVAWIDPPLYDFLLLEDGVLEWGTFTILFITGSLCTTLARSLWIARDDRRWFFTLLSFLLILAALEEISWGQRIFQLQSPDFFQRYNDQKEINIHNTFQEIFKLKTKHLLGLSMLIFGVLIPHLNKKKTFDWLNDLKRYISFPPLFLTVGIVTGAIFMLDFLSGNEEEIGEFIFSVCLFIYVFYYFKFRNKKPGVDGIILMVSSPMPLLLSFDIF